MALGLVQTYMDIFENGDSVIRISKKSELAGAISTRAAKYHTLEALWSKVQKPQIPLQVNLLS